PNSLSRSRLPSSQLVSGSNPHVWHAARFKLNVPCPWLSIHSGSEEQMDAFARAALTVLSKFFGSRVRDKVAASRRKGKWMGGTVPLGYDAKDKKLVVNKIEAETVRYIFKRYLELQSFGKLVEDLDKMGIVTKRRDTKVRKYNGGIPFTYGPLAHFLKNRLYIGETGHKDKWFPGEHAAIVDRKTFEQVQQLLGSKSAGRKAHRTASE